MPELNASITISAIDRFSRQAARISEASQRLGRKAEAVGKRLGAVERKRNLARRFRSLKEGGRDYLGHGGRAEAVDGAGTAVSEVIGVF